MIGYLVAEPRYEPFWNTIMGALAEAEEVGYTLKVFSVEEDTLVQRVQQCIELRLSGLIIRLDYDKSPVFEEANGARIPVISVDESVPQPFGIRVAADDAPGCNEAIAHLVGLGHRKIGFISSGFPRFHGGRADIGSAREVLFRQAMAAQDLDVPEGYIQYEFMMVYGGENGPCFDPKSTHEAVAKLLANPAGRPTAICCWRDEAAMVAARACRLHGLRVPEDISVVGFSDISAARLFDPPLSTIKSPWDQMGRTAVRQLMSSLSADFDPSPHSFLLPTELVPRESSGPAPTLP
jgi:LacI family transcriptional regulator